MLRYYATSMKSFLSLTTASRFFFLHSAPFEGDDPRETNYVVEAQTVALVDGREMLCCFRVKAYTIHSGKQKQFPASEVVAAGKSCDETLKLIENLLKERVRQVFYGSLIDGECLPVPVYGEVDVLPPLEEKHDTEAGEGRPEEDGEDSPAPSDE